MKLSDTAIKHPVTVFTVVFVILVAGLYCYVTLPREAAPDIPIPIITITTTYRGVAPAEMESLITQKIEQKLKGLDDLDEIRSTSSEGRSYIVVKFTPDVDIDDAMQKTRDKVEQVKGELPTEADEPVLDEINISEFPIMSIALYPEVPAERCLRELRELSGRMNRLPGVDVSKLAEVEALYEPEVAKIGRISMVRLKKLAENLEEPLEEIPGVLQVNVIGGREREIQVLIDPDRMAAYSVPIGDLLTLVERENANVSGGNIDSVDASYQVRVPGEFTDPLQIYSLIATRRDGRPIYLTDVARIQDGFADRTDYSRLRRGNEDEARETITITIQKRSGENIVAIAEEAKRILGEADNIWRQGVGYTITMDVSKNIAIMVSDLENNIFSGFVLVVVVVLLFMGFRNSLFVAIAIPLSMLISFAVLTAVGITLNMIVLFALMLSLGMLVDNAIVIVENIYRHMQEGMSRVDAAINGTAEVAWPVATSTLTTVAAFAPLLFWPGIVGEFMSFLPKTVIIMLLSSLMVALVVNPVFCATLMRLKKRHHRDDREEPTEPPFTRAYGWVLKLVLAHRGVMVLAAFMVLVTMVFAFFGTPSIPNWGLARYPGFGAGFEFFPSTDPDRVQINVKAPEGALLDKTDRIVLRIEERLRKIPDVAYVTSNVGTGGGNILVGRGKNANRATVSVEYVDRTYRTQPSQLTTTQIRDAVDDITGATIDVAEEKKGPPAGEPVEVEISGERVDVLAGLLPRVYARIKDTPGLVDLKDDFAASRPEIQFPVDRNRAALLGMSTTWVGQFIKLYLRGIDVGDYREGEDEYDIIMRVDDRYRYDLSKLRSQYVPDPAGNMIPLSTVAEMRFVGGYGSIQRADQKRVITVSGKNARGYNAQAVLEEVKTRLADLPLPAGYMIRYRGEDEEKNEAQAYLSKALLAALILIGLILISQFNSIAQPFIIMAAVLMSLIGVFAGLITAGLPFSTIMTGIGIIGLAGVVVNNGIVLIAYTRQLESWGLDTYSAIVKAGKTRLRPVLLTAITTCLGLLPMALGVSFDVHDGTWEVGSWSSQFWRNMAVSVIFGLGVATFLTLLVEPALYSLVTGGRRWLKWAWSSEGTPSPAAEPVVIVTEVSAQAIPEEPAEPGG